MFTLFVITLILAGLSIYALPATRSLPRGIRPGLEPLTISQAVAHLRMSGKTGTDLLEAARALVADRMAYCRRNSFDPAAIAFERGYGYCQQQAFALAMLLTQLGFDACVVHAFRNWFPGGKITPHAWVRVVVDGTPIEVDSIHYDIDKRALDFTPISRIYHYNPLFRLLAGWGAAAVNAHRYYLTGQDMEPATT